MVIQMINNRKIKSDTCSQNVKYRQKMNTKNDSEACQVILSLFPIVFLYHILTTCETVYL